MNRTWRCPECETLNQGDKCNICGHERLEEDKNLSNQNEGNTKQQIRNKKYQQTSLKTENLQSNDKAIREKKRKSYFVAISAVTCIVLLVCVSLLLLYRNNTKETDTEKYYYFNGHKYTIFNYGMSWNDANEYCEKQGGHLVTIGSADEQNFVQKIIKDQSRLNYWIGLYLNSSGQWEWIDGTEFSYSNWDYDSKGGWNKPDNYYGDEFYGRIFSASCEFENWQCNYGFWDDASNYADGNDGDAPLSAFGFICEWDEQ